MDLNQFLHREPISDRGISVVMPAFNEADCLETVVASIADVMERLGRGHEIIVVDDGSTDHTGPIAERLAASGRRIRLIQHATHLGYGAALRSGFQAAKYPLLLQMDSDNQYVAAEIERLLAAIDPVDVVCGYRAARPSAGRGRFARCFYRWLLRTVFAVRVRDVDCGFKLYRRSFVRRIPIQSNGRFANAEILAKAKFMNMLVDEVVISYRPGESGISQHAREPLRQTLREAVRVFWRPQFTAGPPGSNPTAPAARAA